MSRPCCVYRVFDLGGTLLYVGSTFDLDSRLRAHEQSAPWWPFKADVLTRIFVDEREARAAELAAIATEHPRWNVIGRSPEHPDGQINRRYGRFAAEHLHEEVELWRRWMRVGADLREAEREFAEINDRIALIVADRSPYLARTG